MKSLLYLIISVIGGTLIWLFAITGLWIAIIVGLIIFAILSDKEEPNKKNTNFYKYL